MNTVELLKYGFNNAFGILNQVTADLTQEQADWTPPGLANPIGASIWHVITGTDAVVHGWIIGDAPLYAKENWQPKVLPAGGPNPDKDFTLEQMQSIRVDLQALNQYTQAVAQDIQQWLDSLQPADLERTLKTPMGELNVAQMLETFAIWHLNAHCGEIAVLKGLQGVKGYPF